MIQVITKILLAMAPSGEKDSPAWKALQMLLADKKRTTSSNLMLICLAFILIIEQAFFPILLVWGIYEIGWSNLAEYFDLTKLFKSGNK